jgi:hypothetical protein
LNNILILGYSNIAIRRILPALEKINSIETIEIATKSKNIDRKGKIKKTFDCYDKAIESFSGKIIYISLANFLHDEILLKCLSKGFDCIIDKPAILREGTLVKAKKIARQKSVTFAEATVFNFHSAWKESIEILGGSENINRAVGFFQIPDLDNENFRMSSEKGGGAHLDMSAYSIGIGRVLWDESPKNIEILNVEFDNDLLKSFELKADFGKKRNIYGKFGFGFEYKNKIEFFSKIGSISYERAFSPPCDIEIPLKIKTNDKSILKMQSPDDTFENFIKFFLSSLKSKSKYSWIEKTKDTFYDLKKLSESIESHRK